MVCLLYSVHVPLISWCSFKDTFTQALVNSATTETRYSLRGFVLYSQQWINPHQMRILEHVSLYSKRSKV